MKTARIAWNHQLSSKSLDPRLGQLACYLGAIFVVPTSVRALIRHPGNPAELVLGLALTGLVGLLLVSLGMLCRRGVGSRGGVSLRSRWPEFASIAGCVVLLVMGIRWLAGFGLTPAQVTLGVLLTSALSLSVLVLGMTATVVRTPEG